MDLMSTDSPRPTMLRVTTKTMTMMNQMVVAMTTKVTTIVDMVTMKMDLMKIILAEVRAMMMTKSN